MSFFCADSKDGLSIRANVIWNSVGSIFYLGCNWLLTVLVVTMGTDTVASGYLAVAMSVGNVLASIVLFRTRPIQVSLNTIEYSNADFFGLRCLTIVGGLICCIGYSLFTVSTDAMPAVLLYMLFKAVESYIDVIQGVEQRANRLDLSAYSQILRGIAIVVSFVIGFVCFGSLELAVAFMVASSVAVLLLFDKRCVYKLVGRVKPHFGSRTLRLAKVCFGGFLGSFLITLVVSFVRQIFGLQFGEAELGVYAAIAAPTVIIQALAGFIYAPLYGPLGQCYEAGAFGRMGKFVLLFVFGICAFVVLMCLLSVFLGEWVIEVVYGAQIAARWGALIPMFWATGFSAGAAFFLDLLLIVRSYKGAAISAMASFVVAVIASLCGLLTSDINSISYIICIAFTVQMGLSIVFYTRSIKRFRR